MDIVKHITPKPRQLFAAMMVGLDHSVGQLVMALKESGMLQDTLIVFTSDNGGTPSGQYVSQVREIVFCHYKLVTKYIQKIVTRCHNFLPDLQERYWRGICGSL